MAKRIFKVSLVGLIGLGILLGFGLLNSLSRGNQGGKPREDRGETHQKSSAPSSSPSVVGANEEATNTWTLLPAAELLEDFHNPDTPPEDDLAVLDALLIAYRQVLNENPSGENYEIVEALIGRNRASVAVIPPDHPNLSSSGELLDRWGRPYHFHSISSQRMDIRSAGPDGQLWSDDDVRMDEFE